MVMLLIALSAGLLCFYLKLPYRLYNSDIYHQLAVLKEFTNTPHIQDAYFASGPADLHAGPYYFCIYLFSSVIGISLYSSLIFFAVINIVFIALSLYFLAKSFKFTNLESSILLIVSFLGWGSFNFFFAGIYEFTNLLVTASFPAAIGLSCIFLILGLTKRYLNRPSGNLIALIFILNTTLFISHILSGVVLIPLLGLLVLEELVRRRRLTKDLVLYGLALLGSILLTIFIWPPFGLLDLVSQSKTVEVGTSDKVTQNYFVVSQWPYLLGITFIGIIFIPYLMRNKRLHIVLMLAFSAFMTASYLYPVRVSLYWRYFPLLFLGVSLAFVIGLKTLSKTIAVFLITLLAVLGIYNVRSRVNSLTSQGLTTSNQYIQIAEDIPDQAIVFSDPNTSYHLAALYPFRVVAIPYNHANPAYIPQSKQRYQEANTLLNGEGDQQSFFDKYDVEYVVINRKYYPDFILLDPNKSKADKFILKVPSTKLKTVNNMELYRLQ